MAIPATLVTDIGSWLKRECRIGRSLLSVVLLLSQKFCSFVFCLPSTCHLPAIYLASTWHLHVMLAGVFVAQIWMANITCHSDKVPIQYSLVLYLDPSSHPSGAGELIISRKFAVSVCICMGTK